MLIGRKYCISQSVFHQAVVLGGPYKPTSLLVWHLRLSLSCLSDKANESARLYVTLSPAIMDVDTYFKHHSGQHFTSRGLRPTALVGRRVFEEI